MTKNKNDEQCPCDFDPGRVEWNKCHGGLVPSIVQDVDTGRVLMLAWMNEEALQETLSSGLVTFFSRSRNQLWTKGETSGNHLELQDIDVDCDGDTLLVIARPTGPACHLGTRTCFSGSVEPTGIFLSVLQETINSRVGVDAEKSYTARLLASDLHRVAQKVGEEAVETILAATSREPDALIDEAADLVYHLMVLLTARGLNWGQVTQRLAERHAP
jgi:phosphoribosyl-AMP cyclohydrolase / phosphoribosyl-ATP pyrophosphohydrolase